jgi:hypothetical protein
MSDLANQGFIPKILAAEAVLKTMPQIESHPNHYQIDGVYVRSVFIPAGCFVTGKIHNKESIGILAQGTMRITNGESSIVVSAPYITIDNPGIKRLVYSETDCTFITVHRTDSIEISDIEDELVSDSYEEFDRKTNNLIEDLQ